MLFNDNIVLEILTSNFAKDIVAYIESCIRRLDEVELVDIFESSVDYAILDNIEEMTVDNLSVETDEDGQNVDVFLK